MIELSPEEFRARMAAARDAGRPFFPWDDLEPDAWRRSLQAIESTVSAVLSRQAGASQPESAAFDALAGSPKTSAERPVLDARAGPRALGIAAFTSGTGPLLAHWVQTGAVRADAEVTALMSLHLEHGQTRLARLEAAYHEIVDLLATAGIVPTVIKGFHTAHALFPTGAARPMSDIDMVVAPHEVAVASDALVRAGFARGRHLRRPHMTEWIPPGPVVVPRSLELTHESNPWTLDLHGTFDRDFGGVKTVPLLRSGSPAPGGAHPHDRVTELQQLAGRRVRVLRQPYLTAYLGAHASQELKNLSLIRIIELVWALRGGASVGEVERDRSARSGEGVDWAELEAVLRGSGAAGYVYPAYALVERVVPGALDPAFHAFIAAAAPARVRRIVDRLQPSTAMRLEQVSLEEQFMWASGASGYARRVGRALWPSWAGSLAEVLEVQRARLAQVIKRRVVVAGSRPRG
jgi:hypothetical protein